MKNLFDALKDRKALVCLWQIHTDTEGKVFRTIHFGIIIGNSKDLESLQFQNETGAEFCFRGELVYVYSEHMKTAFKAILLEFEGSMLTLGYPKEMVMIPGGDTSFMPPQSYLDKFNLMRGESNIENFDEFIDVRGYKAPEKFISGSSKTEHIQTLKVEYVPGKEVNKTNSKHFLGLRESPRMAPKAERYATVRKSDGTEAKFRVLDLSRGGAGLALLKEDELNKGDNVEIIAMQGKPLRKGLKGQIMAIRSTGEDGLFKAGIKFVVEEDIDEAA
ncbi:MAG: PilZ domain-containing protein [Xanthomonadaceae bacterium]|nr:PilZ domain-containing protein [Xanthomonadaceae bacterium]